jgi:hypothetical protein
VPALIRHVGGDLAERVERSLVDAVVGDDLILREAVLQDLDRLRIKLAGLEPTPVERLLVQRIVTCWLYLQFAELRAAHVRSACDAQAEFLQRQVDRAQRRFFSAVRTLAAVRRLAIPLNLNVAIGVVGRTRPRLARDSLERV